MPVHVVAQSASPSVHPLPTHSNVVLSLEATSLVCQVGWVEPLELREVEPKVDLWVVSDRLCQRPYMEGGRSYDNGVVQYRYPQEWSGNAWLGNHCSQAVRRTLHACDCSAVSGPWTLALAVITD